MFMGVGWLDEDGSESVRHAAVGLKCSVYKVTNTAPGIHECFSGQLRYFSQGTPTTVTILQTPKLTG